MHKLVASIILSTCILTVTAQNAAVSLAPPATKSPVVVVEFTGQLCRYCPNTSRVLKDLQDKYGKENYLIAALHHLPSYSSLPAQHVSLYNEEAVEYAKSVDIPSGLPFTYIDYLGSIPDDMLLEDKFKQPDLLECTGSVLTDGQQYLIDIQTRLRSDQQQVVKDKKIDILIWALENDIVALQDDNGKWTYPAHQHIFRGSVNGTWGESYQVGSTYKKVCPIPQGVGDVDHTEIIVLFLEHDSRLILDAGYFSISRGDISGINEVHFSTDSSTALIYDLNGRVVEQATEPGIYIQNGRKFVLE